MIMFDNGELLLYFQEVQLSCRILNDEYNYIYHN